ncbi:MAG: hypothetical protein AABY84_06960 [Candidatus Firestonebacteria bacterium]
MNEPIYKIAFLVDKNELQLLNEACIYGADVDKNINKAIKEGDKYRIEFLHDDLDDLVGYIANCTNHEKYKSKQDKWNNLCDKIEHLLGLSENIWKQKSPAIVIPKQSCNLKYYIFDVWIEKRCGYDIKKKVLRKIQIPETKSLYNFAKVITQAFGFYFDHCFGFYNNFKKYHDSDKMYELFTDIGEDPSPGAKGVKNTKIKQAFKKVGEQMLFLFDYGDGWNFIVELKEIKNAEKWDLKPVILESIGKSPMQYPPCKD